jgi:hypothetical protein
MHAFFGSIRKVVRTPDEPFLTAAAGFRDNVCARRPVFDNGD